MGVWPVLLMQALTLADHAETTVAYAALRQDMAEVGGECKVAVLQAQFGMRTEANQLERFVVRLAVNQHEIRLHMTIAMVFPVAGQCVVVVARFERLVGGQELDYHIKFVYDDLTMSALQFPLQVAFELTGRISRPHLGQPARP